MATVDLCICKAGERESWLLAQPGCSHLLQPALNGSPLNVSCTNACCEAILTVRLCAAVPVVVQGWPAGFDLH